jgi:TetR/AcrR family transcriptional regulator
MIKEATSLFAGKGYGSTSVREVVEAAGVTKPTLYYHFGSKEKLFVETANTWLNQIDKHVGQALAGDDPLNEKLQRLLLGNVQFAQEYPDAMRFIMSCLHQVDHGRPEIDMMSLDATICRYMGAAFYQGQERGEIAPEIDVTIAVISFVGVLRAWSLTAFHGVPLPADFHTSVVNQYLNGLCLS